jgi:Putative zinc-finger
MEPLVSRESFQEMEPLKRDDHNPEAGSFDAILRRASAMSPGPATPQCADPELIAAYYDGSLVASERDVLEAHFADCARCQLQLAAIVRADPRASDAAAERVARLRSRWQIAIPALAAAAVLIVVLRTMRPGGEVRHADQLAMAKSEAPASNPVAAPAAQLESAPQPISNQLAMNEERRTAQMHLVKPRQESRAALASNFLANVPKSRAMQMTTANPASGATYGRAVTGAGSAIGGSVGAPETLVMISPRERPEISTQTPGQPSSAASAGAAGSGSAIGAAVGAPMMGAQVRTLASSSSLLRGPTWMAGKRGTILFRDANGITRRQYSGVEADLTAGVAPSVTVCWIVGRGGTVLRTTDGENWTKITPPTDADLVAVAADSAEHAIVTTVAAQNFETSDGGASWHRP